MYIRDTPADGARNTTSTWSINSCTYKSESDTFSKPSDGLGTDCSARGARVNSNCDQWLYGAENCDEIKSQQTSHVSRCCSNEAQQYARIVHVNNSCVLLWTIKPLLLSIFFSPRRIRVLHEFVYLLMWVLLTWGRVPARENYEGEMIILINRPGYQVRIL